MVPASVCVNSDFDALARTMHIAALRIIKQQFGDGISP